MDFLVTFVSTFIYMIVIILLLVLYSLPIILFVKVWKMIGDVKSIKNKLLDADREDAAKIAFLKGDSVKAKDMLDTAYFEELLMAKKAIHRKNPYEQNHLSISRKYDKLYYSMNLTPPDFDLYKDIKNIP